MAHIMLPSSGETAKGNPAKYADTCMEMMLKDLYSLGVNRRRLKAKMAGGAQMFSFSNKTPILKIGERNAEAVEHILKTEGIPLLACDTGGNYGRTINFDVKTGKLTIRTINHGEKVI
jgi:chemotaxis protein CheD